MSFDYTPFVRMAQEMIDEFGRDLTFVKLSNTALDATKPWRGPQTPTAGSTGTGKGVFVEPVKKDWGIYFAKEDLLDSVEQVCLVSAANDYSTYHTITDENKIYKIEWCMPLKPGSVTILYAFGVKR